MCILNRQDRWHLDCDILKTHSNSIALIKPTQAHQKKAFKMFLYIKFTAVFVPSQTNSDCGADYLLTVLFSCGSLPNTMLGPQNSAWFV